MLQLFEAGIPTPKTEYLPVDPHTTCREVQAQDTVLFARTIYENYTRRISTDPSDEEAHEWFFSASTDTLSFLWCCSLYNLSADDIRSAIERKSK